MNIRIYNARILTMEENKPIFTGELHVKGNKIAYVGPASNNCLDMFREMFLVTGLAKVKAFDAAAVDAMDVLRMATVEGAHALGLDKADILAEGKFADLIMIDLNQPNMQPLHNIAKNIVYSGSKQNVKLTMVNGKVLYEDGRFYVGVPAEEIYAKANEIATRVINS